MQSEKVHFGVPLSDIGERMETLLSKVILILKTLTAFLELIRWFF